jgi:hypothetical protein
MSHWENSGIPAAPSAGTGSLPRLYDRAGRSIDFATYVQLHLDDPGYERVAGERVGPYWVSTLWFGIDAGSVAGGRVSEGRPGSRRAPAVYRTLVRRLEDRAPDPSVLGLTPDTLRYATEADARDGHAHAVAQLRDATDDATAERPAIRAALV